MRDSPADLAKWAREEADRIETETSGTIKEPYPSVASLRAVADWLDSLAVERDRLRYLDTRTDLCFYHEAGDTDVGVWSAWIATKGQGLIEGYSGSLATLADELRLPQAVEPQPDVPRQPESP